MIVGGSSPSAKASISTNNTDIDIRTKWLLRPASDDDTARLFCFPYAGVGASAFSAWPTHLGGMGVYPVQFPGRENRIGEQHFINYDKLAFDVSQELAPYLDRPFAFFGHCAGAWVAYETAICLDKVGLGSPRRLFLSGQPAPHDSGSDPMLMLSESELRETLTAVLRSRGADPKPDMIEFGLFVLRRDIEAARAYRRSTPVALDCPISLLRWCDDAAVDHKALEGWYRYSDNVDMNEFAGGQYEFVEPSEDLQAFLGAWR